MKYQNPNYNGHPKSKNPGLIIDKGIEPIVIRYEENIIRTKSIYLGLLENAVC